MPTPSARPLVPLLLGAALVLAGCPGTAGGLHAGGTGDGGVTDGGFPATHPLDLCQGYPQDDRSLVSFSSLPKPARLTPVSDPDFPGTKIVRLTDVVADWHSGVAVPAYPTIQAWNADESRLVLYVTQPTGASGKQGWALLDGKTYHFLAWLPINPADVEQFYWSTTDPHVLYYVDNHQDGSTNYDALTAYDVATGVKTVLHDFAPDMQAGGPLHGVCPYGALMVSGGEDPFGMSEDGDLIGLGCYLEHNGPGGSAAFAAFTYRLSTGALGTPMTVEADVPQALPSGRGTYFYSDTQKVQILDPATNAVRRTVSFNGQEHSDLLRLANGDDAVAGVQYDGPSGSSGTLMWADLTTGGPVHTLLGETAGDPYPPTGTLVSGRAYRNPGWVAVGIIGCVAGTNGSCNAAPVPAAHPQTYLDQEILLANLDTGHFCRVAHDRTTGDYANSSNANYWAQPNVTLSPSGTRILFQSDWGDADPAHPVVDGNAPVDTYVVELPGYQP